MSQPATTHERCFICKGDFASGRYMVGREPQMCGSCWKNKREPKRMARTAAQLREDVLEKRREEMRRAIDERDKYRRERDTLIESFRDEADARSMERIRRMSVWQRLKLVFNPFGWPTASPAELNKPSHRVADEGGIEKRLSSEGRTVWSQGGVRHRDGGPRLI